jgi:hypothetical protein
MLDWLYKIFTPNQLEGLVIIVIVLLVFGAMFYDGGDPPKPPRKKEIPEPISKWAISDQELKTFIEKYVENEEDKQRLLKALNL